MYEISEQTWQMRVRQAIAMASLRSFGSLQGDQSQDVVNIQTGEVMVDSLLAVFVHHLEATRDQTFVVTLTRLARRRGGSFPFH